MLATGMPEGQNLEFVRVGDVVHEVAHTAEKEAAHTRCSGTVVLGANARLFSKQGNRLAEVSADGARRGGAIGQPPRGSTVDLASGASRDLDPKGHDSPVLGQRSEKLFQGDKLTALDFGEGGQESVLL